MAALEALKPGLQIYGILPETAVSIISVQAHGPDVVELFYQRPDGGTGSQLLYRHDEPQLSLSESSQTWTFSADGGHFQLAAEAFRIRLAHLFDPVLAVHTSLIEPLPHQITAVYGEMLPRQPLRFLLADDPGAGKTVMAGLLIKELMVRGDVRRCLICVPGSLAGQWQDELLFKFQLHFDVLTRDSFENAVTGNPFQEKGQVIMRLDQIARDEALQAKLAHSEWDLVIVDEAHKMSASFWGGELKVTKRYRLGELLSEVTRHFLLMTATPHNGKEQDFQLFMSLIDPDRFENRSGEHDQPVDVSDLMRRMVKENLRRFDGRPLFPERRAYTVNYQLSPAEMELYSAVTEYVREEFNRAEQLLDDSRKGTIGFALTVLQRRLASSPAAIHQSLVRRRERLQKQHADVRQANQGAPAAGRQDADGPVRFSSWEDYDEAPAAEAELLEELIMDSATAALTLVELEAEIETLHALETMAHQVLLRGDDQKWAQLAALIQDNEHMVGADGSRRKLVIFTEHRDTLRYLWQRIATLFGREEMMVYIDGGLRREERREIEDRFRNDPDVHFLLATDAAGEGINLQRAHLMINYDLPWNPNRLEQRFGRIHRIGQTEVCHLWNLVAAETREGYVYDLLLRKLATESQALDGQVFDVLGTLFEETPLRRLLMDAVRYGDQPEVRAKLDQTVESAVEQERVRELLETRSLASRTLDLRDIERIRADMERYAARRLQPHYIKAFFLEAFARLGGHLRQREPGRYRVTYVPAQIRERAESLMQARPTAVSVQRQYERICFDKALIAVAGKPPAAFICPGHPLLDAVIDLVLDRHRKLMQQGAALVAETDPGTEPRLLFFLQQEIRDAGQHVISREVHFVEIERDGTQRSGGYAPYLDYRPLTEMERAALSTSGPDWLLAEADDLEQQARRHAIHTLVPAHIKRIKRDREELIDKTLRAVQARLTTEINYWDRRAAELRQQEKEGKRNARLNSQRAQERADGLAERLETRRTELAQARQVAAAAPRVIGGALVVPMGLLLAVKGGAAAEREALLDRRITEAIAMQAVMQAEIALDNQPVDVSKQNLGYDIESLDPAAGRLRFIEVKGRRAGAETVTVTRNEILTGINTEEQFILALVEVADGNAKAPRYVTRPFASEPDFGVTSVNYNLPDLLARSSAPT